MVNASEGPTASADILAAKRTRRPNALKSFQVYTGGWNLMSMDYLAVLVPIVSSILAKMYKMLLLVIFKFTMSAGYMGMPGFVISFLWIITGFVLIVVVTCMYFCCKDNLKSKPDFDRFGNYTTLGLLIIFTVFTIAGCGALFTGLQGLHTDISTVITYMMHQFTATAKAQLSSVPPSAAPEAAETLEAMEKATNSTSTMINTQLSSIVLWLIILAAIMLGLSLIGLVFVASKIKPIIYMLVTIGWLLVMGTWILCGFFLLLDALFGDTCVAMEEWAANPRSGTSFDILVSCGSNSYSSSNSSGSHLTVTKLPPTADNAYQDPEYKLLSDLYHNMNLEFNQLNDQSFNLRARKSVQQKTAVPPSSSNDSCAEMQQTFVPIFNTIVTNNCPRMCRNAKWVWIALITLSTGSTVSICLWIVFTRRCTMKLAKLEGGNIPMFQFQDSSAKKNDAGGGFQNASGARHSTGPSTPAEDGNGGSRRRSKPKTVNININT